jgi:hypothetical protein
MWRTVPFAGRQNMGPDSVILGATCNAEELDMRLDKATNRKGFTRMAVDKVEEIVGIVIDAVTPNKPVVAIEPGSEGGLRRTKPKAKGLSAKKRKRTPLL